MCYTRKDRDLEREARRLTESRLMEEEARHRQAEHQRRREQEEEKPLTEKVKEVVGVRQPIKATFIPSTPGILAGGLFVQLVRLTAASA